MKYEPFISKAVKDLAADLKEDYPSLTDYESLNLALKAESNQLFRTAYVITANDSTPTALEAIALALGHRQF